MFQSTDKQVLHLLLHGTTTLIVLLGIFQIINIFSLLLSCINDYH
jgi:hypothetical protein